MPGWRIASFDRIAARGTITGVGTLSFDASVALVDAFEVGEEVDVALRASHGGPQPYDVLRIAPTGYRTPFVAPSLDAIAETIDPWRQDVIGRRAWIAGTDDGELHVRVEDDTYRPERALVFAGCVAVQGPLEIEELAAIHVFRLGDVQRLAPELFRHWPPVPASCVIFRLDPARFGQGCLYVVAASVALSSTT